MVERGSVSCLVLGPGDSKTSGKVIRKLAGFRVVCVHECSIDSVAWSRWFIREASAVVCMNRFIETYRLPCEAAK
jgi:hypothetical protein